jgi:Fe-S oxidoreductase
MDMEVLQPIQEFRIKAVAEGHTVPCLDKLVAGLKKSNSLVAGLPSKRADWAEGLDVKNFTREKVDVILHVGCQTSFNPELRKLARSTVKILRKAGVNFGIGGTEELCCGGRAYQMGYEKVFLAQAKKNMAGIKKAGARVLVTGCADCYNAFKVLYDKYKIRGNLIVMHISEYCAQLIAAGKLKPSRKVNLNVTYHDPCRLGRLGEPWVHWQGSKVPGDRFVFDPPKTYRRGTNGIYEAPRDVLKSIPGITISEMVRIKEYAWCCGAGGGVSESNPEFALWTAGQRLNEALATGAEALVTACPWCEKTFRAAQADKPAGLKIYDLVELLASQFKGG